jgi:hypothetical protein
MGIGDEQKMKPETGDITICDDIETQESLCSARFKISSDDTSHRSYLSLSSSYRQSRQFIKREEGGIDLSRRAEHLPARRIDSFVLDNCCSDPDFADKEHMYI